MSKTAGSIVESVLRRDPHEVEYIQAVQEVVHSLLIFRTRFGEEFSVSYYFEELGLHFVER